jgi:type I restriction enzyme M protein
MPELLVEDYFKRAFDEGHLALRGEGKNERIVYTASNHSERWADREEKVRAAFFAELIYKYEYSPARIGLEIRVPRHIPGDLADLIVYSDDEHLQPFIVIECKREGISDAEFNTAVDQVCSYRAVMSAPFAGVIAGTTRRFLTFRKYPPLERDRNRISDLPVRYGDEPDWRFYKTPGKELTLVSREELRTAIRKCHQTLWEGGKRTPIMAFGEFSKIVFVKIRDEITTKKGQPYKFQRRTNESNDDLAARINGLYKIEAQHDSGIFDQSLNVEPAVLAQVVEHIESINLNKTELDTKGVAFEEFMGGFFKGDFGQYFTPRELIAFSVQILRPSNRDLVLDPACGSGGFLLYALDFVREQATKEFPAFENDPEESREHWKYWHDFAEKNLYGIEINEELTRVAKMNMIIHDDGHTNIVESDALDFIDKLKARRPNLRPDHFDLILTNPPFGSVVKESEKAKDFLDQFTLRRYLNKSTTAAETDETQRVEGAKRGEKAVKLRASVKTEILFLERVWDFLKPGTGRAAVVVPDGILTNASLQGVRDWLVKRFQILAVVSLPQFAFSHYDAGVKASIVFLRKRAPNEEPNNEEAIFMAQAENIGYDGTGRNTFNITVVSERAEEERVEIQSCDLFDYRVFYEWSTANPKRPAWSERHREVIPQTGIVAQYRMFERDPTSFFV